MNSISNLHLKRRLTRKEKTYAGVVIFLPMVVSFIAAVSGMLTAVNTFTWVLFAVCYCATTFGITVGYHRYLTHRSFKAGRVVKIILTTLGCMIYEGSPIFWCAVHRRHHKRPDQDGDPHSPQLSRNFLAGLVHAHIGWMFTHQLEDWHYYVKDLILDKDIRTISRYYAPIAISGLLVPGIINGIYYWSFYHFFEGVVLCGFVRLFIQHEVTWSVNSICHLFGKQHFKVHDSSRNNTIMALFSMGEGWHNGHHAFPASARHGLLWWQLDVSYFFIWILSKLGLAKNVKLPARTEIIAKLNGANLDINTESN